MFVFFRKCFCVIAIFGVLKVVGQNTTGISFKYSQIRISSDSVLLNIKVEIKQGYKLYALHKDINDQLYSSILFYGVNRQVDSSAIVEKGNLQTAFDSSVQTSAAFFTDTVLWQKKLALKNTDSTFVINGTIDYLIKYKDEYIPGEEKFRFHIHKNVSPNNATATDAESKSLGWIFDTAFLDYRILQNTMSR